MIGVRMGLSIVLLTLAYKETGPLTTVILALLTIGSELQTLTIRKILEGLKILSSRK